MIRHVLDRMKRRGFSGLWPPRPHTPSGKKGYRSDFYRPAPSTRTLTLLHRNTSPSGQAPEAIDLLPVSGRSQIFSLCRIITPRPGPHPNCKTRIA